MTLNSLFIHEWTCYDKQDKSTKVRNRGWKMLWISLSEQERFELGFEGS